MLASTVTILSASYRAAAWYNFCMSNRVDEDAQQLYLAHWRDLAQRSYRDGRPYFTMFLPQEDFFLAEKIASSCGVSCVAWGGAKDTDRVLFGFSPFPIAADIFSITCLTCRYPIDADVYHRDFLGALMACNLEREIIGDILISPGLAQIFVCQQAVPVILQELR